MSWLLLQSLDDVREAEQLFVGLLSMVITAFLLDYALYLVESQEVFDYNVY